MDYQKWIYDNKFRQTFLLSPNSVQSRSYSISTPIKYLDPHWVTGFVDGDGCFSIVILKNLESKLGWRVKPVFSISLHKKDRIILEKIQSYFGGIGNIYPQSINGIQYQVFSQQELADTIIPFFNKYTLLTQKWADFELFKRALEVINSKEHLTIEGLRKIVTLKASLNRGLPDELKQVFPNTTLIQRPLMEITQILNPSWIAGFVSAEGCFMIKIKPSKTKLGEAVHLEFQITQHIRDETLMKMFVSYFKAGKNNNSGSAAIDFRVAKSSDIQDKIIPFFDKYPIIGVKSQDFEDFKKVAELIKNKVHLTNKGLENIRLIKAGMNKRR